VLDRARRHALDAHDVTRVVRHRRTAGRRVPRSVGDPASGFAAGPERGTMPTCLLLSSSH
jgi:hypothetical protein